MSSRIPPLLEPYLALPPEASLILLTNVLGASSNWLILRFLHRALIGSDVLLETPRQDEAKVVLVSFMRDLVFWKENSKRLVGIFLFLIVFLVCFGNMKYFTKIWLISEAEKLVYRVSILINLPQRRDLRSWMA